MGYILELRKQVGHRPLIMTCAEYRNKNSAFKVKMLYSYPVFGASVKLLGDLIIGMMFLFEMLSEAGGM